MALNLITLVSQPARPGSALDELRDRLRRELAVATTAAVQSAEQGLRGAPSSGYLLLYDTIDNAALYLSSTEQMRRSFFVDAHERAPNLLVGLEAQRPAGAIAIDDYMRGWGASPEQDGRLRVYGLRTLALSLGLRFSDGGVFASEHYVPIQLSRPLPEFLAVYLQAYDDHLRAAVEGHVAPV